MSHILDQECHLRMGESIIGELEGLHIGGSGYSEEQHAHRVFIDSMLVKDDSCHLFVLGGLILCVTGGLKRGMHLDVVKLAEELCVLVEFALGFEKLDIDTLSVNGFTLTERPNFLHFKFII